MIAPPSSQVIAINEKSDCELSKLTNVTKNIKEINRMTTELDVETDKNLQMRRYKINQMSELIYKAINNNKEYVQQHGIKNLLVKLHQTSGDIDPEKIPNTIHEEGKVFIIHLATALSDLKNLLSLKNKCEEKKIKKIRKNNVREGPSENELFYDEIANGKEDGKLTESKIVRPHTFQNNFDDYNESGISSKRIENPTKIAENKINIFINKEKKSRSVANFDIKKDSNNPSYIELEHTTDRNQVKNLNVKQYISKNYTSTIKSKRNINSQQDTLHNSFNKNENKNLASTKDASPSHSYNKNHINGKKTYELDISALQFGKPEKQKRITFERDFEVSAENRKNDQGVFKNFRLICNENAKPIVNPPSKRNLVVDTEENYLKTANWNLQNMIPRNYKNLHSNDIEIETKELQKIAQDIIDAEFKRLSNKYLTLGREQFGMEKILNLLVIYFGEDKAIQYISKFNAGKFLENKRKLEMKKCVSEFNDKIEKNDGVIYKKKHNTNARNPLNALAKVLLISNNSNKQNQRDIPLTEERSHFDEGPKNHKSNPKDRRMNKLENDKNIKETHSYIDHKFTFNETIDLDVDESS